MKKSVLTIVLLGVSIAVAPFLMAATYNFEEFSTVVRALDAQIELLKWVGTAVVGGLSVAVATLYFALLKSHKESTDLHVKSVLSADKLGDAIGELNKQLQNRPCIRKE